MNHVNDYVDVRATAQAEANADGYDRGLEYNAAFKYYRYWRLPQRRNRSSRELSCEVVMCEHVDRTPPGHGMNRKES